MDNAMGQAAGKVRSKILRAILLDPACYVNARIFFLNRQLKIRIGFVVAQKDVEFRLVLFDEVVLEGKCLSFIVHYDIFQVGDLSAKRAGLSIGDARSEEIGPDPMAEDFCFANVEDFAKGIPKQINSGLERESFGFFGQLHGGRASFAANFSL